MIRYLWKYLAGASVLAFSTTLLASGPAGNGRKNKSDKRNVCSPHMWMTNDGNLEHEVQYLLETIQKSKIALELKEVEKMVAYKAPRELVKRWRRRLEEFFKTQANEGLKHVTRKDEIYEALFYRLKTKYARKKAGYEALFKTLGRLLGTRSDFETYDLLHIYFSHHLELEPIDLSEVADIWHRPAKEVLLDYHRTIEAGSYEPTELLIVSFLEHFHYIHSPNILEVETYTNKLHRLLEATGDKHYTLAELMRDYVNAESHIRNIDTLKGINRLIENTQKLSE